MINHLFVQNYIRGGGQRKRNIPTIKKWFPSSTIDYWDDYSACIVSIFAQETFISCVCVSLSLSLRLSLSLSIFVFVLAFLPLSSLCRTLSPPCLPLHCVLFSVEMCITYISPSLSLSTLTRRLSHCPILSFSSTQQIENCVNFGAYLPDQVNP